MINSIGSNIPSPLNASKQATTEPALTLTVTADPDNVSTGNKSDNAAEINLTTQKNEFNTTVTREQAVNRLENKLLKNIANNALGNNKPNPSLVKSTLIASAASNSDLKGGDLRETSVELFSIKLKKDSANNALNTFNTSQQPEKSSPSSISQNDNDNQFVALANKATDYYIKSTLFFSLTDRVGQNLDQSS